MLRADSLFGIVCVCGLLIASGCSKKQEQAPVVVVNQTIQEGSSQGQAGGNPQQRYDVAIANAFSLLAEKKEEEALAALIEAQSAVDNDFVKAEIARLKALRERIATAEKIILDIQAIVDGGKPGEAARLATDALREFGDTDFAEKLTTLKRQADALVAVQARDQESKQKFLADAEAARQANNERAALLSFDQAVAVGVEVSSLAPTYDKIRTKLTRYDELRNRAGELRRDAAKLEDAVKALEEACTVWDTPQARRDLDDLRMALNNRRDRLAVADFEVIGDVGIPLVGRTIAEELLPQFKTRYDLVERSQIAKVLEDLKLDPAELHTNDSGRQEVVKLAKARFIVVGSVSRLYGLAVNARMVDAQTGLVVQTAKIIAAGPEELSAKLPELAKILLMTDDEKRAHEQELAKAATIAPAEPTATLRPTPAVPAGNNAPAPPPVVVNTPRPPDVGTVAVADFVIPAPAPQPQAVVIVESPWRNRAFYVAVELGDNLMSRGLFVEAVRYYEFALGLSPGNPDVRMRIDMCRPFIPAVVVVAASNRPRLAVLPFAEIGQPGFISFGMGGWTADHVAPYFFPSFDIADRGETYWWMARLGLTVRDVLVDPSARLLLARAMGVRYFLMGNICPNDGFDVNAQLVDAEFNALTGSATIHVMSPHHLKLQLSELARLILMPPAQQVVYVQQTVIVQQRIQSAQIEYRRGNFKIAIGFYREALVSRPNCVEVQFVLYDAERRQRQWEMEEARRIAFEQQQAQIIAEQQRQLQLAAAAQQQSSVVVVIDIEIFGRQRQQASNQMVVQAQAAQQSGNFSLSISLYQSAARCNRDPNIQNQLAMARAQGAIAAQQQMMLQQAAQQRAMQAQYQQQLAASQAVIAVDNARLQAANAQLAAVQRNDSAAYQQLIVQAQQAKAKGQFDVEVSSLQTARTLRPSPQVEQLYQVALADQARAQADKKGPAERQKLESQLAAQQARRQQIDALSAQNQAKHDQAIQAAFAAMNAKNFAQGKREFEIALQMKRTKEAVDGIRWANDEIAKVHNQAAATAKAQQQQQQKTAQFEHLLAEGKAALAARQFDPAVLKLQAAVNMDPTNATAQAELVRARQAKDDLLVQGRRQQLDTEKQANFQKLVDAGKAKMASKQYDAAIVSLNEALKIKPNDPSATQTLQQVQHLQAAAGGPKSETAAEAIGQARAAIQAKKFDEALKAIAEAGRIEPSNPELPRVRQELATARTASYGEKKTMHDEATERRLLDSHLEAARKAIANKQFDDADRAVIEAQRLSANDPALPSLRQQIAAGRKAQASYGEKKVAHDEAVDRKLLDSHLNAARKAIADKQYDAADRAVIEAQRLSANDPALPSLRQQITEGRKAQAAYGEKKIAHDEATDRKLLDSHLDAARKAIAEKQYDAADRAVVEAARLSANDPALPVLRQQIAQGRQALAAQSATSQNQAAYEKVMLAGQAQFNGKNYAAAIAQFNEALKLKQNDDYATRWLQAAQKAAAQSATTQQKTAYDEAMKTGQAALAARRFDDAVHAAQTALQHTPNDPAATQLLQQANQAKTAGAADAERHKNYDAAMTHGKAAMQAKQFAQASASFAQALKFIPNDPAATQALNQANEAQKQPMNTPPAADAARTSFNQYFSAAQNFFAAKRYEDAYRYAAEALKYVPNDPQATKIMNDSRAALAPPPKVDAPPVKKDPPKADPTAQINQWVQAGQGSEAQGRYPDARAQYAEAFKLAPTNAELKKKVDFCTTMANGVATLNAGRFPDAANAFTQALNFYPNDANAKHYLQLARAKKKN